MDSLEKGRADETDKRVSLSCVPNHLSARRITHTLGLYLFAATGGASVEGAGSGENVRTEGGPMMKIHPNLADGTVHIVVTAREAVRLAEKLFKTAMQSGGPAKVDERQKPTPDESMEREP